MTRHADAVARAEKAHADLERLFVQVGGVDNPQGRLWSLYRLMREILARGPITPARMQEVATAVQAAAESIASELLSEAVTLGADCAAAQLAVYGDEALAVDTAPIVAEATAAVIAVLVAQMTQARAYSVLGDRTLILGDTDRVGLLTPAPVAEALTRWLTTSHQAAFDGSLSQDVRYRKQAIAALSARTTNCCLQVHGQIVDRDKPFILTGTPRFASEMQQPPFHRYCRTVTALVRPTEEDDTLTRLMRDGAQAELTAREQGKTTQTRRSGSAIEA